MIGYWILAVLVAFIAVVAVRTIRFRPKPQPEVTKEEIAFDRDAAVDSLAQLVRCKTVSYNDHSLEDEGEFQKLISLLPTLYPNVFGTCTFQQLPDRALLLRWPGTQEGDPAVMMAHYDVVPVNENEWQEPPFGAVVKDGELWGRGTLDTKGTLHGVMEAAEMLIGQGFVPENDVYFAFGGDEEIFGGDAPAIVEELKKRGIHPEFVLDEGGAIVDGVFPGVSKSAALIGTAEKGTVSVDMTASGKGGHASAPASRQALGILGRALSRIQDHAMPFTLTPPAREMFDILGRESSFGYKLLFANLWCFGPLLDLVCRKSGGELNALVRTTCALTMAQGSKAFNVLPSTAHAGINLRLISGDTIEAAIARLKTIVDDPSVEVKLVSGGEPSTVSQTGDEPWNRLKSAISAAYPGVLVSPYLMLAGSDSRHYGPISEHVYRFSGMPMSKEQRGLIHNANERIPVAQLKDTICFFAEVMKRC